MGLMLAPTITPEHRLSVESVEMTKQQTELDPTIPRIMCPRCGTHMRLAEIEPGAHGEETMRFECTCSFEYRMSRKVREAEHHL
jgi:hypothetical protein